MGVSQRSELAINDGGWLPDKIGSEAMERLDLARQIFGGVFFLLFVIVFFVLAPGNTLFKISYRFAKPTADLRQFAGPEYHKRDHQDHHQLRQAKSKHETS
jgi:hypothetical protein